MFHSVLCLILLYKNYFKIQEVFVSQGVNIYIPFMYTFFYVLKLVGRSWFVEMADATESKINEVIYVPDLHSLISKNTEEANLRLSQFLFQLCGLLLMHCKSVFT